MKLPYRLALAAFTLMILAIMLGYAVAGGHFRAFDIGVSNALNLRRGVSSDWLILLMQGISWIGAGVQRFIIIGLLTVALWRWWGWGAAFAMGITTVVAAFTSNVMKHFFERIRPDLVEQLDPITTPAFPSGHANNAAVFYILFIMLIPQARHPAWQLAAALMILLTGLSRILLGVHWPTDVIGGWLIGTSFALGAGAVISYRQHQKQGEAPSILAS